MSTSTTRAASARELDQLSASERSRTWRLRFRLSEWFARSLVFVPCLYIAGALALAEVVALTEGSHDVLSLEVDNDSARTILSTVAGGMIAFTGLVVSVAVLVVQFGASQYTPRLVYRFRRDPVVKHSLGIFIAPTIFALVSLRNIGKDGATIVPSLMVAVNLLLVIVALIAFFVLVSRMLDLLRPRRIIAQMVDVAGDAIREAYPFPLGESPHIPVHPSGPVVAVVHNDAHGGVLSALDRARIVRAASAAGAVVEVCEAIGGYVPSGAPLFRVSGDAAAVDRAELRRAAILAEERTITQDPAFAIRAIVDIALRALSPAVNDPTTAVQSLDGIDVLLFELSSRELDRGRISDENGALRLVYPMPDWGDLLDLSLTEIRHYGVDSPQIPRRMRALLLGLIERTPDVRHAALEEQLARLDSAVLTAYPDPAARAHAEASDHLGIGGAGH